MSRPDEFDHERQLRETEAQEHERLAAQERAAAEEHEKVANEKRVILDMVERGESSHRDVNDAAITRAGMENAVRATNACRERALWHDQRALDLRSWR